MEVTWKAARCGRVICVCGLAARAWAWWDVIAGLDCIAGSGVGSEVMLADCVVVYIAYIAQQPSLRAGERNAT